MTEHASAIGLALKKLSSGLDLSCGEAEGMMQAFIEGKFTPAQLGCIMMGMRLKGETSDELVGMVRAYRASSNPIPIAPELNIVDLCGTGGDGASARVFNISTTAMFVAAGAGVAITKHGTGAVSSRSGSSDVLQALGGGNLDEPKQIAACLRAVGVAYLHGPYFNRGMRNVIQGRKEVGLRSFFNLLGPMTNPASPRRQVVGVHDRRYTSVIAQTLSCLGACHVLVVSAHNGLDEISSEGLTQISELRDGKVTTYDFDPSHFGFGATSWDDLRGGDPAFNARKTIAILAGEIGGSARDVVLLNAAAAILVSGLGATFADGLALATESLDNGNALRKLEAYRNWTRQLK